MASMTVRWVQWRRAALIEEGMGPGSKNLASERAPSGCFRGPGPTRGAEPLGTVRISRERTLVDTPVDERCLLGTSGSEVNHEFLRASRSIGISHPLLEGRKPALFEANFDQGEV